MATQRQHGEQLEQAVSTLPGIRGARVHEGPSGIEAVRIVVVPEKTTPGAIRDVQSKARDLGIDLDPDRIQVLRTGDTAAAPGRRRRLASIATTRSNGSFTARIALELDGDAMIGEADAFNMGTRSERRSVAEATINGALPLLGFPVEVETVQVISVGADSFAVVTVARPGGVLVGSASVRTDEYDAVARATLDALNRFITSPLDGAARV